MRGKSLIREFKLSYKTIFTGLELMGLLWKQENISPIDMSVDSICERIVVD